MSSLDWDSSTKSCSTSRLWIDKSSKRAMERAVVSPMVGVMGWEQLASSPLNLASLQCCKYVSPGEISWSKGKQIPLALLVALGVDVRLGRLGALRLLSRIGHVIELLELDVRSLLHLVPVGTLLVEAAAFVGCDDAVDDVG